MSNPNSPFGDFHLRTEIPYFSGEYVDWWIYHVECFFYRYQVVPEQKLRVGEVYLIGEALQWYHQWHRDIWWRWFRIGTWEEFVRDLKVRFKPPEQVTYPSDKLKSISNMLEEMMQVIDDMRKKYSSCNSNLSEPKSQACPDSLDISFVEVTKSEDAEYEQFKLELKDSVKSDLMRENRRHDFPTEKHLNDDDSDSSKALLHETEMLKVEQAQHITENQCYLTLSNLSESNIAPIEGLERVVVTKSSDMNKEGSILMKMKEIKEVVITGESVDDDDSLTIVLGDYAVVDEVPPELTRLAIPLHFSSCLLCVKNSIAQEEKSVLVISSYDYSCPKDARQNAYELSSLFLPPAKPPDEVLIMYEAKWYFTEYRNIVLSSIQGNVCSYWSALKICSSIFMKPQETVNQRLIYFPIHTYSHDWWLQIFRPGNYYYLFQICELFNADVVALGATWTFTLYKLRVTIGESKCSCVRIIVTVNDYKVVDENEIGEKFKYDFSSWRTTVSRPLVCYLCLYNVDLNHKEVKAITTGAAESQTHSLIRYLTLKFVIVFTLGLVNLSHVELLLGTWLEYNSDYGGFGSTVEILQPIIIQILWYKQSKLNLVSYDRINCSGHCVLGHCNLNHIVYLFPLRVSHMDMQFLLRALEHDGTLALKPLSEIEITWETINVMGFKFIITERLQINIMLDSSETPPWPPDATKTLNVCHTLFIMDDKRALHMLAKVDVVVSLKVAEHIYEELPHMPRYKYLTSFLLASFDKCFLAIVWMEVWVLNKPAQVESNSNFIDPTFEYLDDSTQWVFEHGAMPINFHKDSYMAGGAFDQGVVFLTTMHEIMWPLPTRLSETFLYGYISCWLWFSTNVTGEDILTVTWVVISDPVYGESKLKKMAIPSAVIILILGKCHKTWKCVTAPLGLEIIKASECRPQQNPPTDQKMIHLDDDISLTVEEKWHSSVAYKNKSIKFNNTLYLLTGCEDLGVTNTYLIYARKNGYMTLQVTEACTNMLGLFHAPRPPELVDLEDKVSFKGEGNDTSL